MKRAMKQITCIPFLLLLLIASADGGSRQERVQAVQAPGRFFSAVTQMSKRFAMAPSGSVLLVTNTKESGPGSLRKALEDANASPGTDLIQFNIPNSDPGYNAGKGVWTIRPDSLLPLLMDDSTVVDGESQAVFASNPNPLGPEIEIDGTNAGKDMDGLVIVGSWCRVTGLAVNRFSGSGITIAGPGHNFNLIDRCYIGVTPDAKAKAPNGKAGVWIIDAAWNFVSFPDSALANVIGGNKEAGVLVQGVASQFNLISVNCIGTDLTHKVNLGNSGDGVLFISGASDNLVTGFGRPHEVVIWNNAYAGIRVSGVSTVRNLLLAGSITKNGGPGIKLEAGGNDYMQPPVIQNVEDNKIQAKGLAHSLLVFYRDPEDEGEEFLGTAYADSDGLAVYEGPVKGPYITALVVDTAAGPTLNNTSEFSAPYPFSTTLMVTTTADKGKGSLREAIGAANNHAGPDTIRFAIPMSDPGFNATLGTWTIQPLSELPWITNDPLFIDGLSQAQFAGNDMNPEGPEIELDGSLAGNSNGLSASNTASFVDIVGLTVNRFHSSGILFWGTYGGSVQACYAGTNARGTGAAPNGVGVDIYKGSRNIVVGPGAWSPKGNIISGNENIGVIIHDSCRYCQIRGNIVGLDRTAAMKIGNKYSGVYMTGNCSDNELSMNLIGGNKMGVTLDDGSHMNSIESNSIGTDSLCAKDFGNDMDGIRIVDSQKNSIVRNSIAYNGAGVTTYGSSSLYNKISMNSICRNAGMGIMNSSGGNGAIAEPTITGISSSAVSGKAGPLDFVELFADSSNEGEMYLGDGQADSSGNWTIPLAGAPPMRYLTATARDGNDNSSEFSLPFEVTQVAVEGGAGAGEIPTKSRLLQNYPNPFNPATSIAYTVHGSQFMVHGTEVKLVVYDLLGREVAVLVNEKQTPGRYSVRFDGRHLASGTYLYRLQAGAYVETKKMLLIK